MEWYQTADVILCIILSLLWWPIGGTLFMFSNAVAHSETNCILSNLKYDIKKGKKVPKYKVLELHGYQILHCLIYCVFPLGYYVIWGIIFV